MNPEDLCFRGWRPEAWMPRRAQGRRMLERVACVSYHHPHMGLPPLLIVNFAKLPSKLLFALLCRESWGYRLWPERAWLPNSRWSPFTSADLSLLAFYLLKTILFRLAVTQVNNHEHTVQFIRVGKAFLPHEQTCFCRTRLSLQKHLPQPYP